VANHQQHKVIRLWQLLLWILEHWVFIFLILFGVMNILPFAAPVFMRLGWTEPAQWIYTLYSPLCHQMAQRSIFLFGQQSMLDLSDLPLSLTGNTVADMSVLRSFIGNPVLGWKVAWSDRMIYMYGAILIAGMIFGVLRHRHLIKPLRLSLFMLLLAPLMIDGVTHMMSDISSGLAEGFRYQNQWLANLTENILPTWFYIGDQLGSFNSWMRLITGLLFGIGCVWFAFPYLDHAIARSAAQLRTKLAYVQEPVWNVQIFNEEIT